MFEIGLPLRGAIHIGDVTLSKRCFAGKVVVDAHRLSEKCQLAGTIVSDEAHKFIFSVFNEPQGYHLMYSHLIIECDIPTGTRQVSQSLSGNDSHKMKTLCWFFIEMGQIGRFVIPSDFDTYVREKFTAHGKKLPDGKEIMKAFNTARLFEHWAATSNMQYHQHVAINANMVSQQGQTIQRQELQRRIRQLLKDTYYPLSHYSKDYFGKIRVDDGVVQIVLNVLDTLEYREESCLCLKYGVTGSKKDFGEIAQCVPQIRNPYVSVSLGRTRQIIAKAMRKLRHPARMDRIFKAMAKISPHCDVESTNKNPS